MQTAMLFPRRRWAGGEDGEDAEFTAGECSKVVGGEGGEMIRRVKGEGQEKGV